MINFPNSPLIGQAFVSGSQSWTWDGQKWLPAGLAILPPGATGSNRIINGDMRIDQRNNGASGTANGVYTVDRWGFNGTQANKFTWGRSAANPANTGGNAYSLALTSASAYALLAADSFFVNQYIEADYVTDFCWGTSVAQPVTLSFMVWSNQAGTFGGCIVNQPGPPTRSYPFTFNIPVSGTWTKIIVTIPGDTGGTWVTSGNANGLAVYFDLGSGATYRGPAGAWANGNYRGATGAVSIVAINGAALYLTGVKLEVGNVATPFNRKSLAECMADCQRYYQIGQVYQSVGGQPAGVGFSAGAMLPVTMRANGIVPTVLTNNNVNWTQGNLNYNAQGMLVATGTATTAGAVTINMILAVSAEL
jgi:hypothetical protein